MPRDPSGLDNRGYVFTQTNFDTVLRYQKQDQWAKLKDFQARIRDAIIKAQALNRIMSGWNSTSRAATYDPNLAVKERFEPQVLIRTMIPLEQNVRYFL